MFNGKFLILCDEKKVLRFGVLLWKVRFEVRMCWFDFLDVICFYYVNVWEEGDEIIVVGLVIVFFFNLFD